MKKEEKAKEVLSFQNDFISINDVINKKIPEEKGCYVIRILEGVKMHSNYRFEENYLSNVFIPLILLYFSMLYYLVFCVIF